MDKEAKNKLIPLTIGVFVFSLILVFFISAWTEPSQSPPGGNRIHYCSTQADITAALADIGSGAGTIVLKPGTINLNSTINISGGGSYIIEGQGDKTVIDCNGDRTAFNITSAASLILRNFKIDFSDITSNDIKIITINEFSNNKTLIDNVSFIGDDKYMGYGIEINSDNVTVKNCNFSMLREMIRLISVSDCFILNNKIDSAFYRGINLTSATRCIITGNYITNLDNVGIYGAGATENTIDNNIILNCDEGVSLVGSSHYNSIVDNTCNDNSNYGIHLNTSNHCDVIGNICKGNRMGLRMITSNSVITGNVCNNNSLYGIYTSWQNNNNTIMGNSCNNTGIGISIGNDCDNNTVTGNTCNNNTTGIVIYNSAASDNTILGNTCLNNTTNYSDNGTDTFDSTATDGDPINNF